MGNYSNHAKTVQANSPEEAITVALGHYSEDFHKRASIYVFTTPPALIKQPGDLNA